MKTQLVNYFSRVKNILLFFSLCFEDLLSCLWFSVVWPWCAFVQDCLCLFYLMSSEHVLSIHFCLFSNLGTFLSFLGFPYGSAGKESTCNVGDLGLIPGLGRSPGEGKGYPLQYSGLENSMDQGAWWATLHGVPKSWAGLSDFHFFIFPCSLCRYQLPLNDSPSFGAGIKPLMFSRLWVFYLRPGSPTLSAWLLPYIYHCFLLLWYFVLSSR